MRKKRGGGIERVCVLWAVSDENVVFVNVCVNEFPQIKLSNVRPVVSEMMWNKRADEWDSKWHMKIREKKNKKRESRERVGQKEREKLKKLPKSSFRERDVGIPFRLIEGKVVFL
jgi:hypothetical protein